MRYKKFVQGETGQAKKYHKWPWSSNLEFLDDSIKYRPQSSNITESQNIISPPKEKTPSIIQNLQKSNLSSDESPSSSRMQPQKKLKIRPAISVKESSEVDRVIEYLENKKQNQKLMMA